MAPKYKGVRSSLASRLTAVARASNGSNAASGGAVGDQKDSNGTAQLSQAKDRKVRAQEDFKVIMGRDMDASALANFEDNVVNGSMSYSDYVSSLAASPGSRVNPEDYGVRALEAPADDAFYNSWRRANPNAQYNTAVQKQLKNEKGKFGNDINAYDASLAGEIHTQFYADDRGGGQYVTVITPEAVERMGGKVTFKGEKKGEIFMAPAGVDWKDKKTIQRIKGEAPEGMEFVAGIGNPTKGLGNYVSDWTGIDESITVPLTHIAISPTTAVGEFAGAVGIKEGAFLADPIGLTSGLAGGSARARENISAGASLFNTSEKNVMRGQGAGRAAAQIALAASGVGLAGMAAFSAGNNANQAASGFKSWGDALIDTGVSTATSFLAGGNAYLNAAYAGAGAAITTAAKGGSFSESLESGAWGAGGSLLGAGAGAVVGEGAGRQGLAAGVVNAGLQEARYGEVDFSQAAVAGAGAAVDPRTYGKGSTVKSRLQDTFGGWGGDATPNFIKRKRDEFNRPRFLVGEKGSGLSYEPGKIYDPLGNIYGPAAQ